MTISLTGFMGCGKSSVGKRLSELLCCSFADLDTMIEEREGCTVAEIFERSSEAEFRRIEKEVLTDILCAPGAGTELVLALGGGAVMTEGSDRLVHDKSLCIYLRTSVDELVRRLSSETSGRPLLKSDTSTQVPTSVISAETTALRKRILDLMSLREHTYRRTAHLILDTDSKSIDDIAREIISAIQVITTDSY